MSGNPLAVTLSHRSAPVHESLKLVIENWHLQNLQGYGIPRKLPNGAFYLAPKETLMAAQ
jgi:hypothetical protein